jgi:hypothetical protein
VREPSRRRNACAPGTGSPRTRREPGLVFGLLPRMSTAASQRTRESSSMSDTNFTRISNREFADWRRSMIYFALLAVATLVIVGALVLVL